MADPALRWVARLVPAPGTDSETLLGKGLGLDVWERQGESLVVAADERQLAEVERRLLAAVERICPVAEFEERTPGAEAPDPREER
jgi:hypothetical protein